MIDGTYKVEIDTPLGHKSGNVVLSTDGDEVLANIDAPIIGKRVAMGHADGDSFSGEGSFKVPLMGTIEYSLKGRVDGDNLSATISTNQGDYELSGVRV